MRVNRILILKYKPSLSNESIRFCKFSINFSCCNHFSESSSFVIEANCSGEMCTFSNELHGSSVVPSSSSASSSSDLVLQAVTCVVAVAEDMDVDDVNDDETKVTAVGESVVTVVVVDAEVEAMLDDKETTSPSGAVILGVTVGECKSGAGCEMSAGCVVLAVLRVLLITVVMVVVVVDALVGAGDVVSVVTTLSSSPPPLMLKHKK